MEGGIAPGVLEDARPLYVEAGMMLVGHADPAMQLYCLFNNERADTPDRIFGCRYRALLRQERASARGMCLDFGRGYAKFGLARNSAPAPIQICTPGSEASEATTVLEVHSASGDPALAPTPSTMLR